MTRDCNAHQGKQSHNSKAAAVAHARSAAKDLGHQVSTYRCPGCKRWFVGGTKLSKVDRVMKLIDDACGGTDAQQPPS